MTVVGTIPLLWDFVRTSSLGLRLIRERSPARVLYKAFPPTVSGRHSSAPPLPLGSVSAFDSPPQTRNVPSPLSILAILFFMAFAATLPGNSVAPHRFPLLTRTLSLLFSGSKTRWWDTHPVQLP